MGYYDYGSRIRLLFIITKYLLDSVHNLEIIEPLHSTLLGTSNKKRSLFQTLKSTRTAGGYAIAIDLLEDNCVYFVVVVVVAGLDFFVPICCNL